MGLITKKVEVELIPKTITYYQNKGYEIPKWVDNRGRTNVKRGTKIFVKVEDLPDNSKTKVSVECDNCTKILDNIGWCDYLKCVKEDGKYYCTKCASRLYGIENYRKTRLKNSKSFEQWCIENNRQDVLNRWDYKLNNIKPNEIGFGSRNKFYFKCPRNMHDSELKSLNDFTTGHDGVMDCKVCNSFAQWGIDNIDNNFLDKYWDWEKNNELDIDPWLISKCTNKPKFYIKCQNDILHGSYYVDGANFNSGGSRCPICNESKGEIKIYNYLNNYKIYNIRNKEFEGLVGLNNGNLSYDFYSPDYNLLIEYQGEFHDYEQKGKYKRTKYLIDNLEKQKEHDRRKKEYAKRNNINLLEIWYWDYDKIEEILNNCLGGIKL